MKIAYLLDDTPLCGGVKVVFEHARLLSEKGFSVTVITRGEQPQWFDLGNIGFLPIKKNFSGILDLLSSFDLVIATYYEQVLELYDTSVKLLHFSQGYEADYPFWKHKKNEIEMVYRLPVYRTTISRRVEYLIKKQFHLPVYYIPQGIDIGLFPGKEPSIGIKKVIVVGTWENGIKGIRDAVKGFSIAKGKENDLSLVRVSALPLSGEEKDVYTPDEYYTAVLPEDMAEIYRQCDLAVVPSLEGEGFGLPAVEAMACSLPVILTKIHSFLSLDNTKDYAYFVSPGSAEEIAEAIIRLCREPVLTGMLSKRGREVAEKFSLDNTGRRLIEVIKDISNRLLAEKNGISPSYTLKNPP